MIDIHSHILPGVDDGAKTWEMAVEMCRMAAADGITHVVATPHSNDVYRYDRQEHEASLQKLREKVDGQLELSLGCDFHMSYDNIVAVRDDPSRFCIGKTNYLLVEFSDYGITRQLLSTLEEFLTLGLIPIVTHPERNRMLHSQPDLMLQMASLGCVIQVTASSFTGFWGSSPRKMAEWLLKKESVHVLATDAHDPEHRKPILSEARDAVTSLAGKEVAQRLVSENPQCIVTGRPLT